MLELQIVFYDKSFDAFSSVLSFMAQLAEQGQGYFFFGFPSDLFINICYDALLGISCSLAMAFYGGCHAHCMSCVQDNVCGYSIAVAWRNKWSSFLQEMFISPSHVQDRETSGWCL